MVSLHVLDRLVDFFHIQLDEHITFLDRRAMFDRFLDRQTHGPRLRLDGQLLHLLSFEDAFDGRFQLDRTFSTLKVAALTGGSAGAGAVPTTVVPFDFGGIESSTSGSQLTSI